jgi:hypothetical protein
MQTGYFRHLLHPAIAAQARLTASNPATLLFIQSAQQQIELPMILSIRMITRPTRRATAGTNRTFHDHNTAPLPWSAESLPDFTTITK